MFEIKKETTEYENKTIRLPRELIDKIYKLSKKNNLSFNKIVLQCIEYALSNMK